MGKFADVKIDLSKVVRMTKGLENELKSGYKGAKVGYVEGQKHINSTTDLSVIALRNNFGDPANKIPPRPFMSNAAAEIGQKVPKIIKKRVEEGESLNRIVTRIAREMLTIVKASFTKHKYEPNAPITIHGGWMRRHGKSFYVKGKGNRPPLIHSFDLQNSARAGIVDGRGKVILLPPDGKKDEA